MRVDLLLLASELATRGEAFALATVVRREPPSSARVGDVALVTRDGTVHGWVGGSCTQPTVLREVRRALADGTPRLITLSPSAEPRERAGVAAFPMTCHSGGSVDIYIDPLLPPPRLLVFGRSPIAQALARLAKAMGYAVDAIDPGADRAAFPEADRLVATLDPARLRPRLGSLDGRLFAVVATMGQYDEEALLTALALEPAYVGVIASRTRFAQLRDAIAACGAPTDGIERIKCPAGLDIGAQTPEEIALSVLAEIVRVRRATEKELGQVESIPGDADEARDPVCGMMVSIAAAVHHAELGGRTFYFCCGGCRALFLSEPERYADAISAGEHSRAPP